MFELQFGDVDFERLVHSDVFAFYLLTVVKLWPPQTHFFHVCVCV